MVVNSLKKLTYRPKLIALAKISGLRPIIRWLYYAWARPRDGVLRLTAGDVNGRFHIRSMGDLRLLESWGGTRGGEKHILESLMHTLQPGDTFYDVGASVGLYSVFVSEKLGDEGTVIAFEPEQQTFTGLLDNLSLNGSNNVRPKRKALGELDHTERLCVDQGAMGGSSFIRKSELESSYQVVDVVNGDKYTETENLPMPSVVKIDVEGYEEKVIQGLQHTLSHPDCRLLCCEIHHAMPNVDLDSMLDLIRSLGFNQWETHMRNDTCHVLAYK